MRSVDQKEYQRLKECIKTLLSILKKVKEENTRLSKQYGKVDFGAGKIKIKNNL